MNKALAEAEKRVAAERARQDSARVAMEARAEQLGMGPSLILAWRKRTGLTQRAAAKALSISRRSLQEWETGRRGRHPEDHGIKASPHYVPGHLLERMQAVEEKGKRHAELAACAGDLPAPPVA